LLKKNIDDFTKSAGKTPAPNTYDQKIMTIEAGEKKGWSFGLSREVNTIWHNSMREQIIIMKLLFFVS